MKLPLSLARALSGAVLAGALGLSAAPAFAGETVEAVVESVEKKYTGVETLQASFSQTITSPMFGAETQTGQLTIKRPRKMRWEFTGGEKLFVTNGATMWVYSKEDNQVIQYDDLGQASSTADALLQSLDNLDDLFSVKLVDDHGAAGHTLDLTPKGEGEQQFKSMTLSLDGELRVSRVVIVDPFDNVTDLAFNKVVLDGQVADSVFEFAAPDGAEVVKAGG